MAIQDSTAQDSVAAQGIVAQQLQPGATIITFPEVRRRPPQVTARRLTLRDRVEALRWADAMRPHGVSRAAIHSGGDPQIGDFILVYLTGALWASWVVGCKPSGYCVWRAGSGADLGSFPTLAEALAAVDALL